MDNNWTPVTSAPTKVNKGGYGWRRRNTTKAFSPLTGGEGITINRRSHQ